MNEQEPVILNQLYEISLNMKEEFMAILENARLFVEDALINGVVVDGYVELSVIYSAFRGIVQILLLRNCNLDCTKVLVWVNFIKACSLNCT